MEPFYCTECSLKLERMDHWKFEVGEPVLSITKAQDEYFHSTFHSNCYTANIIQNESTLL